MLVGSYPSLVIYVRNHRHVVGANQYMPLFQLQPKILRAKNTASSSKRFMCQRLWGSDHSPKSACPRTLLTGLQSMRQSWPRHVTSPSPGEHPAEETLAARPQSFDAAAGDHDAQRPEVHAVQVTRDFSQNCSGRMCSKLSSLKRHREDKLAAERASPLLLVEVHSQIR